MGKLFFFTIILLILTAIFTQQSFVFTLLYLLIIIYLVNLAWSNRIIRAVKAERKLKNRAFPDETVHVKLELINNSRFPMIWGRLQEGVPLGLSLRRFERVVTLGPKDKTSLEYELKAIKRGYYEVGPLKLTTGDLMGFLSEKVASWDSVPLIIYPKVVPLHELGLPSHAPLGTKKHHQPIFEDPTRPIGKRLYQPGDSLRRIDWKSSAITKKLQVKIFEPAIALETAIFLDLNINDYDPKRYFDAIELAITTAASVANWAIESRQTAGLFTNGNDPFSDAGHAIPISPQKGRGHLMRILELLARIQSTNDEGFLPLIQRERIRLSWGATMVILSGSASHDLFDQLIPTKRSGIDIVLILCGVVEDVNTVKARAKMLGIQFHHLQFGVDLPSLGNGIQ